MAPIIRKPKWEMDLIQCRKCGFLFRREYKECPKCKHKSEGDSLMAVLK